MKVNYLKHLLTAALFASVSACTPVRQEEVPGQHINNLAETYVKTVLKLGQYDSDIVDAYYGPEEWKPQGMAADTFPGDIFIQDLSKVLQKLANQDTAGLSVLEKRRIAMLRKQVRATITKVEMMQGKKLPFNEEAKLLYDIEPPHHELAYFDSLLSTLDEVLPGEGNLADRWSAYRSQFVIPREKLDTVFQAAIAEARRRTKAFYKLPAGESFRVEYVTDKPWSGYNYFQGNSYSLIQINTDFPITIERAIDLACHEGYPGHHVFNVLLEQELVHKRGWKEYTVYPLFSPQSLIAEGSANYGIEVAFPAQERLQFEKEVLFPLAGLNPAEADRYYTVLTQVGQLNYAGNEAAQLYLDGKISREEAADLLVKYTFSEKDKALQRTRFIDRYRSYVINYNLGQDVVRKHIEAKTKNEKAPAKSWEVFYELLSSPYSASMLQQ